MVDKYKLQQQDIQSMDLNTTTLDKLRQLLPEVFTENHTGNLIITFNVKFPEKIEDSILSKLKEIDF